MAKISAQRVMKILNLAAFAFLFAALIFYSQTAAKAALNGLIISATVLIPSIFPLSVVSGVIVRCDIAQPVCRRLGSPFKSIFKVSKNAALPFVLGALGGYPLGALCAAELKKSGRLSKSDLRKLICFCSNCSPAFIFGVAGPRFPGVNNAGLILYCAHMLSALIIGVICARVMQNKGRGDDASRDVEKKTYTLPAAFTSALESSAAAMLSLAGYISFFYIVNEFIFASGILSALEAYTGIGIKAVLAGLFEFSTGIMKLGPSPGSLPAAAFLIGFGGLAVTAQTASVLGGTDVKIRGYILAKLTQGILSYFLVTFILLF